MLHRLIIYLTTLVALCVLPLSAETSPQPAEDKKPSWIERIFGTKEKASEDEESAQPAPKNVKAKTEDKIDSDANEDTPKAKADKAQKKSQNAKFTEGEREILEDWQKGKASWKKSKKSLPPGLQKKVDRGGELPPGWKKKLEIGTTLDPEIDEAARPLPEEILSRLPEIPKDTEIVQIGDEIVRVIESTREIVDILDGFSLGSD